MTNFTQDEKKLVECLRKTGLTKNEAMSLVIIASSGSAKRRMIEDKAEIRQPEVSIAVNSLREMGWVEKEDEKLEGKGRPVHVYMLASDISELLKEIEKQEKEKIQDIKDNLERIKKLAGDL